MRIGQNNVTRNFNEQVKTMVQTNTTWLNRNISINHISKRSYFNFPSNKELGGVAFVIFTAGGIFALGAQAIYKRVKPLAIDYLKSKLIDQTPPEKK